MMRKGLVRVLALSAVCAAALLSAEGPAFAADAPRWVATIYIEAQKSVGLRWLPVPGVSGYKVFRSTAAGKDQQEIATATAPQYIDGAVEPGSTYFYSLKSVADAELSPFSDEKSVTIPGSKKVALDPPELNDVTLQVSNEFGKTTFRAGVTWKPKGASVAFNLYRSTEAGKQGDLLTSTTDPRYVDVALEVGKTYYYRVTALDSGFQETPASVEKSVAVTAPEQAAAVVREKKEYAKMVAIPIQKGTPVALPTSPYDIVEIDGVLHLAAAFYYVIEGGAGGEIKEVPLEGYGQVTNIGVGLDGEVLLTLLATPRFIVKDGSKIKEGLLPTMLTPVKNEDGKEMMIQVPRPLDITQNIDGRYWVTDGPNARVLLFGENLKYESTAAAGTDKEVVFNPGSINHDSKGTVFVAAGALNAVYMYDKDGNYLGQFGETGNIAGTFGRITGLFIDAEDNLWITDMMNHTIQKFDNKGKFLGALSGLDGKSAPGLASPVSIVVSKKLPSNVILQGLHKNIVPFTLK